VSEREEEEREVNPEVFSWLKNTGFSRCTTFITHFERRVDFYQVVDIFLVI
jgi:hypothetical protein